MSEKFELSPEQQKEKASRTVSDAHLILKGAEYSKEGVLQPTKETIDSIHERKGIDEVIDDYDKNVEKIKIMISDSKIELRDHVRLTYHNGDTRDGVYRGMNDGFVDMGGKKMSKPVITLEIQEKNLGTINASCGLQNVDKIELVKKP